MTIGYARVSTQDQKLELQKDALLKSGCDIIFEEKVSGKSKERPQLVLMFEKLRKGDTLVVWKLDRLGRSLKDLIELVARLKKTGVTFMSINDSIDTSTSTGRFTFNVFASLAEFEREMIRERTMAGLQAARARGRKGGRPEGLSKASISKAKAVKSLYDQQSKSMAEIGKDLGLSRATCYRYLEVANNLEKKENEAKTGKAYPITEEPAQTKPVAEKDKSKASLKANKTSKTGKTTIFEPLINNPIPSDPRNKIKFEIVSLADARRLVKSGGKCWTDIMQENANGKKLTYFTSPDKAVKEREKTNSNGRIWIENPETKDVAYIVDKKDRTPL